MSENLIVTCAVMGSSHTPTMNPDMPVTVEEMVQQMVGSSDAQEGPRAFAEGREPEWEGR